MSEKKRNRILQSVLCSILLAGILLSSVSCNNSAKVPETSGQTSTVSSQPSTTTEPVPEGSEPKGSEPEVSYSYYTNPILDDKGDPFVMRWNGRYYLYPSSGSRQIECWSSTDLVNWDYAGVVAENSVLLNAYAPEVVYYNGSFYMYTSPNGQGHYVLRSDSPTGPFEIITGNEGRGIDGDVFIDDDGTWYFLTSGGNCITRYIMSSPWSFGDGAPLNAASMANSWTEGPNVVKHDGLYYLTYTGNHVLHKGYRIGYAVGDSMDSLIKGTDTMLVSTIDEVFGPGHSSTVKGPDLDSYWLVYHTLLEAHNGSPTRAMNIDRLVFNGGVLEVLGPTTTETIVPSMPDLASWFSNEGAADKWEGGKIQDGMLVLSSGETVLSKDSYSGDFTAEFCLSGMSGSGLAGIVIGYQDAENYVLALLNAEKQCLTIKTVTAGTSKDVAEFPLTSSFGETVRVDCIQALQVECTGSSYTFFLNDHDLGTVTLPNAAGSDCKIGFYADGTGLSVSYAGLTGQVHGSSASEVYRPIPGSLQAKDCLNPGENTVTAVTTNRKYPDFYALDVKASKQYDYRVRIVREQTYDLGIRYQSANPVTVEISVDKKSVYTGTLPATDGYVVNVLREVPLPAGNHVITVVYGSDFEAVSLELTAHDAVEDLSVDFEDADDGNTYTDGPWTVTDGNLVMPDGVVNVGKRLYGLDGWGDYSVEMDFTLTGAVNCGLLVRATNPDSGNYYGTDPSAPSVTGTDYVQGYFIGFGSTNITISKQDYNWTPIVSGNIRLRTGKTYRIRVDCIGADIKVYVDGKLIVEYTDPNPFLNGRVGVRAHNSPVKFDNLKVTAIKKDD